MDPEWIAEIGVAQGGPGSSAQASDPYGSEADSYGCRGGILEGCMGCTIHGEGNTPLIRPG